MAPRSKKPSSTSAKPKPVTQKKKAAAPKESKPPIQIAPSVDHLLSQSDEPQVLPVSAPIPSTPELPIKMSRLVELVDQQEALFNQGRECYQKADEIATAIREKIGLGNFPLPDGRMLMIYDPFICPKTGDAKKASRTAMLSRYEFKVKDAPKRAAKIKI